MYCTIQSTQSRLLHGRRKTKRKHYKLKFLKSPKTDFGVGEISLEISGAGHEQKAMSETPIPDYAIHTR